MSGLNPSGLGNTQRFTNAEGESISTEDLQSERQTFAEGENNPVYPNQPHVPEPLSLGPHPGVSNPVITPSMVDDVTSPDFAADPFLVYESGQWYCFFEVGYNSTEEINAYATSPDLDNWTYGGTLDTNESPGSSYPNVFKTNGEWYMTPSGRSGVSFGILKATNFPRGWALVEEHDKADTGWVNFDPTPVYWNDRWYVFGGYNPGNEQYVSLIYAEETGRDIEGKTWSVHPNSPIETSGNLKPAGRPLVHEDYLDLPLHDTSEGTSGGIFVRGYRVTELSPTAFTWAELGSSPILEPTRAAPWSWEGRQIHHVDLHRTRDGGIVGVYDGQNGGRGWQIGICKQRQSPSEDALAELGSTQTIVNTTFTRVNFVTNGATDASTFDFADAWDDVANEYVVPKDGVYYAEMKARASDADITSGMSMQSRLRWEDVSAATTRNIDYQEHTTGAARSLHSWPRAAGARPMEAGDKIFGEVWHNAGVGVDLNTTSEYTSLRVQRLR